MSAALHGDDFAARAAALEERVSADPPTSWRPNDRAEDHPRMLVGEFVRLEEGHAAYGPAKIVVLRDGDGRDWSLWLLHAGGCPDDDSIPFWWTRRRLDDGRLELTSSTGGLCVGTAILKSGRRASLASSTRRRRRI